MNVEHGKGAAARIQDDLVFGEFGDVNASICDSSTFTFMDPGTMRGVFEGEVQGCYLYSRHWNPTTHALAHALAKLEDTEAALVTASGMAAITTTLLQLCSAGDHVIASRTIYGGTYAFLKNVAPRLGIQVTFVNAQDLEEVRCAVQPSTRVVYTESISNPLLEFPDLEGLAEIAHANGAKLVVDNTFSPMLLTPRHLGADVIIHSLTKFVNGMSDCVGGCICADQAFIDALLDINSGAAMLLGPAMDSMRAASILKNLHTLHIRMRQHSKNAKYLADNLYLRGFRVFYPGLPTHPQYDRLVATLDPEFGFGGMMVLDVGTRERADQLMRRMQEEKVGYLAVSLGYFKTLFSAPAHSTSSEIPVEDREAMRLGDGLVRFSVGLDQDIDLALSRILGCLDELDASLPLAS